MTVLEFEELEEEHIETVEQLSLYCQQTLHTNDAVT